MFRVRAINSLGVRGPWSLQVVHKVAPPPDGLAGVSSATVFIYQRTSTSTPPTVATTGACIYTFATGALTGTVPAGWSGDVPGGTGYLWLAQAVASAAGPTDTINNAEWSAAKLMASDGLDGDAPPDVEAIPTAFAFITPAGSTTPAPSTITVTADTTGVPGATYTWQIDGVTQGSTTDTLVVPSFPATGSKRIDVIAAGTGGELASDRITLFSLRDGSDAYSWGSENENQTVTADASGVIAPSTQLPMFGTFYVVRGATILTSGVTFSVVTASITGLSGVAINSTTGTWTVAGMTADAGSVIFQAVVASGPTLTFKFTASKAKQATGTPGVQGNSARRAYALYAGNPAVTGSTINTTGSTSLPNAGSWSPTALSSWSATTLTPTSGQSLFQSDGTFDPVTNITTWQVPYLSNFKVGNLAALSAVVDGLQSVTIFDPVSGSSLSRQAALAINTSGAAEVGGFAFSTSANRPALQGQNANGFGVHGYGSTGVWGWAATSSGTGVLGTASGAGSRAVAGRSAGNGTWGGFFDTGGSGGGASNIALAAVANNSAHTALSVTGTSRFTGQIISTATGAPLSVTSTTVVANLNADLLDGEHAAGLVQSIGAQRTQVGNTTVGAAVATFNPNNKPGGASGNVWLEVRHGGNVFWVPAWPN